MLTCMSAIVGTTFRNMVQIAVKSRAGSMLYRLAASRVWAASDRTQYMHMYMYMYVD